MQQEYSLTLVFLKQQIAIKKALCVALTSQMQKLINETDDVDDILAMTYEAEKTNTSVEITGVLPQPLYNGDSVNAFYNRTHVIQSYD